jgi:hypothetical protein
MSKKTRLLIKGWLNYQKVKLDRLSLHVRKEKVLLFTNSGPVSRIRYFSCFGGTFRVCTKVTFRTPPGRGGPEWHFADNFFNFECPEVCHPNFSRHLEKVSRLPQNFSVCQNFFSCVSEFFSGARKFFVVPRNFFLCHQIFFEMSRNFLCVTRIFLCVSEFFCGVPKFFVWCPEIFLWCPEIFCVSPDFFKIRK